MAVTRGWLRVLGSAGGHPVGGLPCSGYLMQVSGRTLLLDCGPGVATALIEADGRVGLDAVVVSHVHPDHVLDLVPLAYALLTEWLAAGRTSRLPLYLPEGGVDFLRRLSDLFGHRAWRFPREGGTPGRRALASVLEDGGDWLLTVFEPREYRPGETIALDACRIETLRVDHGVPTAAMRIGADGASLVYTADTRFLPALATFAAGADLLLADAHLSGPKAPGGAHMTPAEAGRLAALADVGALVLCHLGAPEDGPSARAAAATAYRGPIHLAAETREYRL